VRFFVDAQGRVDAAAVLESSIGNHAVECCIADIAIGVVFKKRRLVEKLLGLRPSHRRSPNPRLEGGPDHHGDTPQARNSGIAVLAAQIITATRPRVQKPQARISGIVLLVLSQVP
jgi:hypothetical protein